MERNALSINCENIKTLCIKITHSKKMRYNLGTKYYTEWKMKSYFLTMHGISLPEKGLDKKSNLI